MSAFKTVFDIFPGNALIKTLFEKVYFFEKVWLSKIKERLVFLMKKMLSLVLALMMVLLAGFACAEEAVNFEDFYPGEWVEFEGGFQLYLPTEWPELEITADLTEAGIGYGRSDGEWAFLLGYSELDADLSVEELQAILQDAYSYAEIIELQDCAVVCYLDEANDSLCFAALDGTEPGMYIFCFTPASNEDLQALATVIMASLTQI